MGCWLRTWRRYLKKTTQNVPPMTFIQADSRGAMTVNTQNKIFSQMGDTNKAYLHKYFESGKKYNIINAQFTLHYYLSDEESWNNFCESINNHIEDGGYFLVTCFDGQLIQKLLENKSSLTFDYTDNKGVNNTFVKITKKYNDDDKTQHIGLGIGVYNSTISSNGKPVTEYLVQPDFLIDSLNKKCGLSLVEGDSFYNIYNLYKGYIVNPDEAVIDAIGKKRYEKVKEFFEVMDPATSNKYDREIIESVKASFKFTMLNKYYIFRKGHHSAPSRIQSINHEFDIGNMMTYHMLGKNLYVDPIMNNDRINDLYHSIKEKYSVQKPTVYLVSYKSKNNYTFAPIKKGSSKISVIIYKTPNKKYYLLRDANGHHIFKSKEIINELNNMIQINNMY
jgi:hypothetical protein